MKHYSFFLSLLCATTVCFSNQEELSEKINELESLKIDVETIPTSMHAAQKGVGSDAGYHAAQEMGKAVSDIARALEKIAQANITIAEILAKTGNQLGQTSKEISKEVTTASTNFGYNFGLGTCSYMSDCIKKTITTTKKQITTASSFLVKTAKKPAGIIAIAGLILYKTYQHWH